MAKSALLTHVPGREGVDRQPFGTKADLACVRVVVIPNANRVDFIGAIEAQAARAEYRTVRNDRACWKLPYYNQATK